MLRDANASTYWWRWTSRRNKFIRFPCKDNDFFGWNDDKWTTDIIHLDDDDDHSDSRNKFVIFPILVVHRGMVCSTSILGHTQIHKTWTLNGKLTHQNNVTRAIQQGIEICSLIFRHINIVWRSHSAHTHITNIYSRCDNHYSQWHVCTSHTQCESW